MSNLKVSVYCPFCHRHTSLQIAPVEVPARYGKIACGAMWEESGSSRWWIGVCNYCQHPVLVHNDGDIVYPSPEPSPTDENIPKNIRQDLVEAKICYSVSAWRACAVMARRAIQSTAIDKGATGGDLVAQISDLAAKGVITVDLKEWATVVRWVGNDAAHPGKNEVKKEEAEDILHLAEQFLHVLYVTPAIAKARRAKLGK